MSLAIGGSNQNSQTSGVFVDVRDFGAKAVDGFDNTPAFQAAIDYVGAKGGGTVYIPGGGANPNYWYLDKPVYINKNYITIQGDGENSSILRTWGPAIMFAWHPRLWKSRSSSY
ncbi:MAG: glycosyl hydrolase family 28-related protein, partial [bacterium]